MKTFCTQICVALALAATSSVALAKTPSTTAVSVVGSCSDAIAQVEALTESSAGNPLAKPSLPQSIDAQLHRQPTRESLRQAEERASSRFAAILAHAKMLNAEGKTAECMLAVTEARRLLENT